MYPESLIWKAAAYSGFVAAVTFFVVGYQCAKRRTRNFRHDHQPLDTRAVDAGRKTRPF